MNFAAKLLGAAAGPYQGDAERLSRVATLKPVGRHHPALEHGGQADIIAGDAVLAAQPVAAAMGASAAGTAAAMTMAV